MRRARSRAGLAATAGAAGAPHPAGTTGATGGGGGEVEVVGKVVVVGCVVVVGVVVPGVVVGGVVPGVEVGVLVPGVVVGVEVGVAVGVVPGVEVAGSLPAPALVLGAPVAVAVVVDFAAEEIRVGCPVVPPRLVEEAPIARWAADEPVSGKIEPKDNATTAIMAAAMDVTAATLRRRRSVAARRYTWRRNSSGLLGRMGGSVTCHLGLALFAQNQPERPQSSLQVSLHTADRDPHRPCDLNLAVVEVVTHDQRVALPAGDGGEGAVEVQPVVDRGRPVVGACAHQGRPAVGLAKMPDGEVRRYGDYPST
jgi:hypothetical protein